MSPQLALLLALLAAAPGAGADSATKPTPAAALPRCDTPAHRAFDFWIGEWEVWANDALAGSNRIEPLLGGCALSEHWRGASGLEGRSYNAWDAASGRWRQFWVASQGNVLMLEGGMRDGAMVLEGVRPHPKSGAPQRQRIAWTRHDDGSVRQLWETSDDAGATWQVAFDGRYRRAAPDASR
ncbi:MAG TPA: hypothetical protein VFO79_10860 [Xanthomonadales bacterium]|nr:hypothetical protein [Xanthomonadales bacterium]